MKGICSCNINKIFISVIYSVVSLITLSGMGQVPGYFKYFDKYNVDGSFILYDMKDDSYLEINNARCTQRYSPASTFKIFNSLVALEAGVVNDENYVIKWDGIKRTRPEWNKDQDLKTALKNSTIWYYQELARRVGEEKMKYYITLAKYGNMDISGAIDSFWISGNLRISQKEQLDFLIKLYKNELPFSLNSQNIVKKIMLCKDTLGYKLRAKTGWGIQDSLNVGWYVGWVEKDNSAYFFATNIESKNPAPSFPLARIEITYSILRDLKILP